ncbi:hypothetical protein SAMN05216349_13416 [Oribacterium sp. KHPX15]|uniref:class I SAM-dependent methyltransferase n=1 Tax=Oribacterium sp. KHPX15 TaxID=1855342 RepID=UPI0008941B9B|nr:class I SAM-dependent methyltransferase [Oribacterium sp. KHPX15]SEA83507.1 hypothetical protein SAMN05216349_13416 [Oribacterium sp. KHPX15]
MRTWDKIFPDKSDIVIWGAGKNGEKWARFLMDASKHLKYFVDNNLNLNSISITNEAGKTVTYEVKHPDTLQFDDEIVLISPYKYVEEIFERVKKQGGKRVLIANILNYLPMDYNLNVEDTLWCYPGHFYSLYPSLRDIREKYDKSAKNEKSGLDQDGIDLKPEKQLVLLDKMNKMFDDAPKWLDLKEQSRKRYRYKKGNTAFGLSDALVLHFILRLYAPNRIIEVGSGFSSAATLDTNEYYMNNAMEVEFIEPYPQLLYSLIKKGDNERVKIYPQKLQEIPLDIFRELKKGDILFIDSTHVSKFGSDVNYLFFHILPCLEKGVLVHFHDIFYPWEYPEQWLEKRAWNELYMLRAFLQGNKEWEPLFFNHYLATAYKDKYHEEWQKIDDLGGGSFWMRKK